VIVIIPWDSGWPEDVDGDLHVKYLYVKVNCRYNNDSQYTVFTFAPYQAQLRGMAMSATALGPAHEGAQNFCTHTYMRHAVPLKNIYMKHATVCSSVVFYVIVSARSKLFCGPSYAAAAQINMTCARASHPNSQRAGMQWRRPG
jgi:hypothetical protein